MKVVRSAWMRLIRSIVLQVYSDFRTSFAMTGLACLPIIVDNQKTIDFICTVMVIIIVTLCLWKHYRCDQDQDFLIA